MEEVKDKQKVKLDEILKSLFNVSKKVLIQMMNSLFKEDFEIDMTEISFENNEFVSDEYDIIRGDLFLKLLKEKKPYHYHIEFQTKNDTTMVLRMFEYGFRKAKELSRHEDTEEITIYIPKQLVIFIEENKNIKDNLKMKLIFPNNKEVDYVVPVMKYWEYNDKSIIQEKMYPLLPLQVFKLRHKMESIKKKGENNKLELYETLLEAKNAAETIAKEGRCLYHEGEIDGEDLHRILLAIANLFEYLNTKYGDDEKLEKEVFAMTKTLYDPIVEEKALIKGKQQGLQEGIKEGIKEGKYMVAKKLLMKGQDLETVVDITDLSRAEVEKLIKEIE